MRHLLLVIACGACTAALGTGDPHAVAPRYDRWEAMIARPRFVVFDAALRVLADSGYVLAQSSADRGVISTADRRPRSPQGEAAGVATPSRTDYPVRLSLVMTPQGADSTRLSITGQYRPNATSRSGNVDVRSEEWRFVRGIGEAILTRLR